MGQPSVLLIMAARPITLAPLDATVLLCICFSLCVCVLTFVNNHHHPPYNHYTFRKIQKNVWESLFLKKFFIFLYCHEWLNLVAIRIHSDPYHIDPPSPNHLSSGSMGRRSCHPHMCPTVACATNCFFVFSFFYFPMKMDCRFTK